MLYTRWIKYVPALVPVDQCGFVYHRYLLDVLHRLFDTLDKVDLDAMTADSAVLVQAVLLHSRDLDKCFDRVCHTGLWRVFNHASGHPATFDECDIATWQDQHTEPFGSHFPAAVQWFVVAMKDHECSAMVNGSASAGWTYGGSVYQGCNVATLLFSVFGSLEQYMQNNDERVTGVQVYVQGVIKKALSFIFADDWQKALAEQPALIQTLKDLQNMTWPCFHAALDNETIASASTGMRHSQEKQVTAGRGILCRYPEYQHPAAASPSQEATWVPPGSDGRLGRKAVTELPQDSKRRHELRALGAGGQQPREHRAKPFEEKELERSGEGLGHQARDVAFKEPGEPSLPCDVARNARVDANNGNHLHP
eukprot:COSAG01_NODE_400_length_17542_cov_19.747005_13_plen_366_part_00